MRLTFAYPRNLIDVPGGVVAVLAYWQGSRLLVACAETANSACSTLYAERPEVFSAVSGAQTTFWHGKQVDLWVRAGWRDPRVSDQMRRAAQLGDAAMVQRLAFFAHDQRVECLTIGGTYWETRLHAGMYVGSIWRNNTALAQLLSNKLWGDQSKLVVGTTLLIGGMCAPASCKREEVAFEVVPQYLREILFGQASPVLPTPKPGQVQALMLSAWSDLQLDFAIIGVEGCGTTSMRMNLQQHPEIRFSNNGAEDYSLVAQGQQQRLLPLRSQVDSFNQQWSQYGSDVRLHGLALPGIYQHSLSYHALSFLPKLRALIIVCDPLGRFEKWYYNHRFCRPGYETTIHARSGGECSASIRDAFNKKEGELYKHIEIGPHLRKVVSIFGERLFFLHQDMLRNYPSTVYNGLVLALGASSPFPADVRFFRWNVLKGHRTDLCQNVSILRTLKRRLASEYMALEALLLTVGHRVSSTFLRQTRCDRPEDLEKEPISDVVSLDIPSTRVSLMTGFADLQQLVNQ